MKTLLKPVLLLLLTGLWLGAASREEVVFLFENRKLSILVPANLVCATEKGDSGVVLVRIADPKQKVSGELRFLPDPEERFVQSRARKELINEMFSDYVPSSTEKGLQFEELEPRLGKGTYCVFTDANLVGKTDLPAGEYLHLTAGLKAWPGVVAVFRVFSNDTTSAEYQAVLKMLRESVEERAVPLK